MTQSVGGIGQQQAQRAEANEFGQAFKAFRTRERLTQRQCARILKVDESTIARLEAGTRRPPREVNFYERLRELPGITVSDIAALLSTDDAPQWLVAERDSHDGRRDRLPMPVVASVPGVRVPFHLEVEPGLLEDERELNRLQEVIKQDIESCLEDYLRLKEKRAQRLKAV
jgi:transcriptional regulator with XRE-family HTH domain